MAIIDGRVPEADAVRVPVRVVVKLTGAAPRILRRVEGEAVDAVSELSRAAEGVDFTPYFNEGQSIRAAGLSPFDRYVVAVVKDRDTAERVARSLRTLRQVEEAYVEGGPTPPPVNPADDPRSPDQGYLAAAPDGIDALWTWGLADGTGVRIVDMERGWTLDHEDLVSQGISIISGLNQDFTGHGTAVLGEMLAADNTIGGVGIAVGATGRVVSQWRDATTYNTAAAILSAGQSMSVGDVLLLEAQTSAGGINNLPVEVESAVFDAIRKVTDDGIIVVEAGGNGSTDLDGYTDSAGLQVLNRGSADFRDSGAIMVGAGSSSTPHTRLDFSNFGSRIDCFAWGQGIDTTGDGWQGNATDSYTGGFGGTSGASPIIAGAVALLQSWRKKGSAPGKGKTYSPSIMRAIVAAVATNTPSASPATDKIGVMPNLRAIIEAQQAGDRFQVVNDNHASMVYILFGLIDDGPGVVWVPGKGPVPVDPGWLLVSKARTASQRDLLAALAVTEIAQHVAHEGTRSQLNASAAAAMHAAVDRIAQGG